MGRKIDAYGLKAKEKLDAQVKIFTREEIEAFIRERESQHEREKNGK
jgi:hypothetical protein